MGLILAVALICVVSSSADQRAKARAALRPAARALAPVIVILALLLLI